MICTDVFLNFLKHPQSDELNNPDRYLMIPYVVLREKPVTRAAKTVSHGRAGGSIFGGKPVSQRQEIPDYNAEVTEDRTPGFRAWAEQFYGSTWQKIQEITNETDSTYRW